MGVFRQTRVLAQKDLKIVAFRRWLTTFLRALALPIAYIIFIAYARNFFLPPSKYGIGTPRPILDLTTEVFNGTTNLGGRNRVIFINNGHENGEIEAVIDRLSSPLRSIGVDVRVLPNDDDLLNVCQSSLIGFSKCYASASFTSSPTEGGPGGWAYEARIDAGLGLSVFVDQGDNAAQIYVLPFLQAIDAEIARLSGSILPSNMLEQPFTYETIQDRDNDVQQFFMRALSHYLAVTLFIAICGVTFHLPGYMAVERESGVASLVDVMSDDSRPWATLTARLASHYLSFVAMYIPGWLAIGTIVSQLIFTRTPAYVVIPFHILLGLSITGYALLAGSFFRKAQLSGITALILSLGMAVVAQFVPRNIPSVVTLGVLFPPSAYTLFAVQVAQWEETLEGAEILTSPLGSKIDIPGYAFFAFLAVQIFAYPLLAAFVQRRLHTPSRSNVVIGDDANTALKLQKVSKVFKGGWMGRDRIVQAVNDVSLSITRGQLVTLLGVNGSGKSTLLAGVTGTQTFSSGSIAIARRSTIGFCPQSNIGWDDLTVLENVNTFAKLKTRSSSEVQRDRINELVNACGLESKKSAKPGSLSGGQRRKLQLAMAFAGGSSICCVDEASSGLDPLSRRMIWDILLAERGRRTIILTTHALDEADALSDHIAVMSKGRLIAEGSSAELKETYGGGFRISSRSGTQSSWTQRATHLQGVRTVVEDAERRGTTDIDIQCPTIEDVFLELAQQNSDWSNERNSSHGYFDEDQNDIATEKRRLNSSPGKGTTFLQQVWVLFAKRCLILRRNYMPYFCAVAVPAVVVGLGCWHFRFSPIPCSLGSTGNDPQQLTWAALEQYWGILVPVGPADSFDVSSLPLTYGRYGRYRSHIRTVDNYADFQAYIRRHFRNIVPGGYYLGVGSTEAPLMSYRINGNPGYAGLAKTLADSYLSGTRINADFSTFALPINSSTGDSLQLILYITLALCAYPAFLALYPTFERLANVRALHYSSGVRPAPLWLGYLLFDGVIAVIMSVVVIVLLTVLSSAWYAPGYLFLAIFFYAVCSTLLAYTGSLFSKTQLSAFALVAGFQAISMLIYFILYLALLTFGTAERLQHNLNTVQYTYGLISPAGCLFRALLLALNQSQLLCRERSFVSYPGGIEVYGAPYLYLILQSFGLYAFLVCYDSYSWTTLRDRIRPVSTVLDAENMASTALNPSIRRELERTKSSEDELRLLNLSKRFHRETAVDDVTFGVDKGQILALLGPNGAGKTTTISLIRGDLRPSSTASQALVSGHSVQKEKLAAHRHLGVCPQFNATDRVTVREHLKFYARIRGVRDIDEKVHAAVKAFGLYEYRKRFVVQLSGGNQRRLSLATAMIGNPSVVLLDEPSTGMDALAMRKMWQLISSMKTQAAVVITTHSMEEASVLSDKAAIMRKRLLAVGSPDALRDSYAVGVYQLHIVHRKGSATSTREIDDILNWLMQSCPGLRLDGREASSMHGQIRCRASFENSNNAAPVRRRSQRGHQADHRTASRSLLQFLERLEETKERFGVAYYSVHRPTLEDVFLDILDNSA